MNTQRDIEGHQQTYTSINSLLHNYYKFIFAYTLTETRTHNIQVYLGSPPHLPLSFIHTHRYTSVNIYINVSQTKPIWDVPPPPQVISNNF